MADEIVFQEASAAAAATQSGSMGAAGDGASASEGGVGVGGRAVTQVQGWHGYPDRSYFCDRSFLKK